MEQNKRTKLRKLKDKKILKWQNFNRCQRYKDSNKNKTRYRGGIIRVILKGITWSDSRQIIGEKVAKQQRKKYLILFTKNIPGLVVLTIQRWLCVRIPTPSTGLRFSCRKLCSLKRQKIKEKEAGEVIRHLIRIHQSSFKVF